jgi:hypothetical protein
MKTLVEERDAERAASGARPPPAPKNPITLLDALYGPDLTRLRRPKGAPESDVGADFKGFDRYMLAGDWREPFRARSRPCAEPRERDGGGSSMNHRAV